MVDDKIMCLVDREDNKLECKLKMKDDTFLIYLAWHFKDCVYSANGDVGRFDVTGDDFDDIAHDGGVDDEILDVIRDDLKSSPDDMVTYLIFKENNFY